MQHLSWHDPWATPRALPPPISPVGLARVRAGRDRLRARVVAEFSPASARRRSPSASTSYRPDGWVGALADAGYAASAAVVADPIGAAGALRVWIVPGLAIVLLLRVTVAMTPQHGQSSRSPPSACWSWARVVVLLLAGVIGTQAWRGGADRRALCRRRRRSLGVQGPQPLGLAVVALCAVACDRAAAAARARARGAGARRPRRPRCCLLGTAGAIALASATDLLQAVVGPGNAGAERGHAGGPRRAASARWKPRSSTSCWARCRWPDCCTASA